LPGGIDPNRLAKKIKAELVKAAYSNTNTKDDENVQLADFIKSASLGDFIKVIPTGQSKISLTAKGEGEELKHS
jgi:hypothetical protein